MGMNWEGSLVIGFVIDKNELEMPFKQEMPEEWHMEKRFSSRTGKELDSVKVIDSKAHDEFFLNGERLDDSSESLTEALMKETNCNIRFHGDMCLGDDLIYSIEPKGVYQDMTLDDVVDLQKECKRIRQVFKDRFGIELGEPKVMTAMSYS